MSKNLLITGYPGVGKTTLIKKLLAATTKTKAGFYTEEIRDGNGQRIGFKVVGIHNQKEATLAQIKHRTNRRVGKYYVQLEAFEEIMKEELTEKKEILFIDEIGKMELFSEKFKQLLLDALKERNVVATITYRGGGYFVKNLKQREDSVLVELTKNNRATLGEKLLKTYQKLFSEEVL